MEIKCINCGGTIEVKGLGRKPLNIGVKNVYDTVQACSTARSAAEKLGCSRPYLYKVLKSNGLTRKEIMTKGKVMARLDRMKEGMQKDNE